MYSGSTRNSGMLNVRKCICTQVVHEIPEVAPSKLHVLEDSSSPGSHYTDYFGKWAGQK